MKTGFRSFLIAIFFLHLRRIVGFTVRSSSLARSNVNNGERRNVMKVYETSEEGEGPTNALGDDSLAKLKVEASSPFRLLRQFIYGAMFAGGGVGTVTQLPQLIQAFQNDGDKVNALINVGIDSGAVIAGVFLWKSESDKAKIKLEAFTEKQNQISGTEAQARENILGMLPVEIQVSEQNENSTKIVSLNDLNLKGMQNVIIVAGDEKFVKDTVISARLEGNDMFTSKETMVIPFIVGVVENQLDSKESKGFGNKQESLMSSPYIAKPQQLTVWEAFIQKEIEMAENQGTKDAAKQGIVVAIKKTGKVVRRGIGMPPWKIVVEDFKK